jgi:hypothetical protein
MRAARLVIWLAAVALLTGNATSAAEAKADAAGPTTLREKFAGKFLVGVAADGRLPEDYTDRERELMLSQFSALTPANCMKMGQVQRHQRSAR